MSATREQLTQAAVDLQKSFPLDWTMHRRYRLPSGSPDQPFYNSWHPGGGVFGERWDRFDSDGVLRIENYNACSIAAYALYCYERVYDGDASAKEPMLRQTEYLLRTQREDGAYPYEFGFPQYGLQPGWISGIAQGKAAAALWRAYVVTSDARYKEAVTRALLPLTLDVADGGTALLRPDITFFEEIGPNPTHILNGHLCAAFAVWEACRWGAAPQGMREIHEASIETLLRLLPQYDDDGWSYYQLAARGGGERHYAPINYHQTHVAQLEIYHAMTGRGEFLEMSHKWRAGLERLDVRARVWADSSTWLLEALERRLSGKASTPWRSLLLQPAG